MGLIAITLILIASYSPAGRDSLKPHLGYLLHNGRALHVAASQMAEDFREDVNESCGWPGELALREGAAQVVSVSGYLNRLMELGYLTPEELAQHTRGPGLSRWDTTPGTFSGKKHCPFKIYRITREDSASTLFLATRNFTYGKALDHSEPPIVDGQWIPLGSRGKAIGGGHKYPLVIVHKDGSARSFHESRAAHPQDLGLLPGRQDRHAGTLEESKDTLIQE